MESSRTGLIYGIHPNEIPAMQLGELLRDNPYGIYLATQGVRRATNYKRAMKALDADLLLDIHASSYSDQSGLSVPRRFLKRHFILPDIPISTSRINADYRNALLLLGEDFPVFSVSHLVGRVEHSRCLYINSNGNLSKYRDTTRWTTRGWTKGTYSRVITAELCAPIDEFEKGVPEDVLHEFREGVSTLAKWVDCNHLLFTE